MGEYDEADQIFSHKLTLNPKDFEAVLGRFLCAGRWKSLKDIDLDDRLNDSPLLSKEIEGYQRQKDELEEKVAVLEGECRETGVRINEVIEILSDAGY